MRMFSQGPPNPPTTPSARFVLIDNRITAGLFCNVTPVQESSLPYSLMNIVVTISELEIPYDIWVPEGP